MEQDDQMRGAERIPKLLAPKSAATRFTLGLGANQASQLQYFKIPLATEYIYPSQFGPGISTLIVMGFKIPSKKPGTSVSSSNFGKNDARGVSFAPT